MVEDNYQLALDHYDRALENANTSELQFQAHFGAGSAAAALASLDEAQEHYESALEIKP